MARSVSAPRFDDRVGQLGAGVAHLASVGLVEPGDAVGQGRLAAARLADQAEDLAGADLDRDVVDGDHPFAAIFEDLDHMVDVEGGPLGGGALGGRRGGRRARRRDGLECLADLFGGLALARRGDRRGGARGRLPHDRHAFREVAARVTARAGAALERVEIDEGRVGRLAGPGEQVGLALATLGLHELAAGREHAAGQRRAETRQEPGDGHEGGGVLAGAEARHAAQEAHGVGVARVGEQIAGRALFDDAPGVHDPDALAHAGDHAEVVADQQDGGVDAGTQVVDQVEHLGLDRGVEAGRRLVEHEQARVARQRHGDHHALLLTAGELERVAPQGAAGVGHGDALERARGRARARPSSRSRRGNG